MFKVVVTEIGLHPDTPAIVRFEQTVDLLDLRAVISAVNQKPRKAREPKAPAPKKGPTA
jgi:hypothetical protein